MYMKMCILALSILVLGVITVNCQNNYEFVSNINTEFSSNLLVSVSKEKKGQNLIISPFSVQYSLMLLERGACGEMKNKLQNLLYNNIDDESINNGLWFIQTIFTNFGIANNIFVDVHFPIKESYISLINNQFRATPMHLDFYKSKSAVQKINAYVEGKTNKIIKEIISEGDITPETQIVIVNAINFVDQWKNQFYEEKTKYEFFHLVNSYEHKVLTMIVENNFIYGNLTSLNAQFIRLPYQTDGLEMIIIMPFNVNDLYQIESQWKYLFTNKESMTVKEGKVELHLPKFTIESTFPLNDALEDIGLLNIFKCPNLCQISNKDLVVSRVKQKAFIEVNELGTKAAAVTEVTADFKMGDNTVPEVIKINNPFWFGIINNNVTVFHGFVFNPVFI